MTDRYTKAIEQLGSEGLDVRLGAIYALERIMIDSERDHPAIVEVLAAFVREHSRAAAPTKAPDRAALDQAPPSSAPIQGAARAPDGALPSPAPDDANKQPDQTPHLATDVQAALTVLGRRPANRDERGPVDLARAKLDGANLNDANLSYANLTGAHLARAHLGSAHLAHANLTGADLADANLNGAHLNDAYLPGAKLTGANLTHAELTRADLFDADLDGAYLNDAYLPGANLNDANLNDAKLTGAKLTNAHLDGANLSRSNLSRAELADANLGGANLTGAKLDGVILNEEQRSVARGLSPTA